LQLLSKKSNKVVGSSYSCGKIENMSRLSKITFIALFIATIQHHAKAQDTWSLERCVRYAQETSLSVQEANVSVKSAKVAEIQSKAARMPNLNASISGGGQFGRTIDPVTNQFTNIAIGQNSLGLSSGVSLYNGGQIKNTIKQSEYQTQAAKANAEQIVNNLSLQIARTYVTILLSEEQLTIARRRVVQSQQQLKNTDKLIEVGTLPIGDRLNLVAQIAKDEQQVVTAQNSVDLAYLDLKSLLQLEPDANLLIERPAVVIPADAAPELFTLKNVYATAQNTQPSLRAGEFNLKSAETQVKIAEGGALPSLSLFGRVNSSYSSFSPTDAPYFNQINNNFGQSLGISLDIPIYQNGRTRANVERAKLQILTAQINNNQIRQQLKTDIQTSIANARAAKQQVEAAQKSYEAFKMAYENMQKRHALGAVNALELTTSKNNLDSAENDLLVSRYDYLFKLKIIDFYNGKKMTLD
jgi:outer membrane protein